MQFFLTDHLTENIRGKQILLDNDFLGLLFKRSDFFQEMIAILSKNALIIDPLTEFEFLRDIYIPEERILREQFINFNIFMPAVKHQELFNKIQENALLLSKLYAHHSVKSASTVDLLLAGRVMYHQTSTLLLTGNKKDFPNCVFDTLGIISVEIDTINTIKNYAVIEFSRDKFDKSYTDYLHMENIGIKHLSKEIH